MVVGGIDFREDGAHHWDAFVGGSLLYYLSLEPAGQKRCLVLKLVDSEWVEYAMAASCEEGKRIVREDVEGIDNGPSS